MGSVSLILLFSLVANRFSPTCSGTFDVPLLYTLHQLLSLVLGLALPLVLGLPVGLQHLPCYRAAHGRLRVSTRVAQLVPHKLDRLFLVAGPYGLADEVGIALELEVYQGQLVTEPLYHLSLIHISEPTRLGMISYAVFCLK